jgi:UDP-2,3-diacylglucosamine pyrophosphatase LpxH
MKIRTLFISDIHLGNKKSNPKALLSVFKKYEFENLIIIGDFIDLTSLKRKFYWNIDHSTVIQKILKYSRKGVNIHYIIGNHDFYLRALIEEENINIGNIELCDDIIWETNKGERIYICHGDQFDGFIRLHPILYHIGDIAYEFSFKINRVYNSLRRFFKLNEWSLSSYLKNKVKNVISYINDFRIISVKKANEMKCDSIMIGHIHTPAIEKIEEGKFYYNTGDMVESCSYIIEDLDGNLKLLYHKK